MEKLFKSDGSHCLIFIILGFSAIFFFKSLWVSASTVLGNQLRLVDIANRVSDLAVQLCSEITQSDSQQVRNKMESLEEGKLEINFRSCVVIFYVWALLSSKQNFLVRFLETIPCYFQRLYIYICGNPGSCRFSASYQSEGTADVIHEWGNGFP